MSSTITCSVLQQISQSVSDVVSKSLPESLSSQINELSQQVQQVHDLSKKPINEAVYSEVEPPRVYLVAPEPPFQHYSEDYLEDTVLEQTLNFLSEQVQLKHFSPENGHSVLSFGEPYMYVGAKGAKESEAIPPQLQTIIETFATKLKLKHIPNSVLINHYPPTSKSSNSEDGDTDSYLPFHSDDEAVIQPDSSIVTISLGGNRSLKFKAIHNDLEPTKSLTPCHNSVYTMTRSSQGWFKHGIEPVESSEERFSLTFRCISQKNKRSVIIQGDSNTKNIKFGTGAGTVGETYPGKRLKASKVSDISPESCIGYSNVVLVCGTNDLRVGSVRDESDIRKVVDLYRTKLYSIKQLAPSSKIFVVPVLPTRNASMNRNITRFNSLLDDMLSHCFKGTVNFPGVYSFLDSKGLLSTRLTRDSDDIHLGERGIAQFVRLVKLWIFECEARERRLSVNSSRVPGHRVGSRGPT
jgi:alkylated DNA repair dioxygenase AlkB